MCRPRHYSCSVNFLFVKKTFGAKSVLAPPPPPPLRLQEPVLFATSIADNIAYGREGSTKLEVRGYTLR